MSNKTTAKATENKAVKTPARRAKTVQIVGDAVVFTSQLAFETIQKLEKYNKKALVLVEKDGEEVIEIFKVATGDAHSVSKYGIVFGDQDKHGFATATIMLPSKVVDKKQFILDQYGETIANLKDLEVLVDTAVAEVEAKHKEILNDIIVL